MTDKVEETQQAPAGIGLADIAACVQIIDIVTKRGAFEGAELTDVGAIRDKLVTFLDANKPAEPDAEEDADKEGM